VTIISWDLRDLIIVYHRPEIAELSAIPMSFIREHESSKTTVIDVSDSGVIVIANGIAIEAILVDELSKFKSFFSSNSHG
jgi:hypothetical protein